jgi:glycosyltransferase involved in cell wall biosynthesis
LPVAAFRNAGIPEVVIDGETGILTVMFSEQQYTEAIKMLLINQQLREEMGCNARRYVHAHHNIDMNYRRMEGILKRIAHRRPALPAYPHIVLDDIFYLKYRYLCVLK